MVRAWRPAACIGLFGGLMGILGCQPVRAGFEPEQAGERSKMEAGRGGTFIRGARIFDGERFLPPHDLWLNGGVISAMAPTLREPADAKVIDATKMTALPGLIDAHTHTFLADHLLQAAIFGVTTELDMLAEPQSMKRLKEERASGALGAVADFRSTGNGVLSLSAFGDYELVDSETNLVDFVARCVGEGSDYIKILQDDGSLWGLSWPSVSKQVVNDAIDAAHRSDLLAVVHAPQPDESLHAVNQGADGLISIYAGGANPALEQALNDREAFLTPTMSFMLDLCGEPVGLNLREDVHLSPYLSPSAYDALAKKRPGLVELSCDDFREAVKGLVMAKVLILAGTDAPQPGVEHGVSLHAELQLLVEAGATTAQALHAATGGPADAFAMRDRGRLAPNLRADVLLVGPDLEQDILITRDVRRVFVEGKEVERPRYD